MAGVTSTATAAPDTQVAVPATATSGQSFNPDQLGDELVASTPSATATPGQSFNPDQLGDELVAPGSSGGTAPRPSFNPDQLGDELVAKAPSRSDMLEALTSTMNPLEAFAARAVLSSGGKLGDMAIGTLLPLAGYVGGGLIGATAGAPEAGVGAIPGAALGAKIGGGLMGGTADALTQARQYFRGERNQVSWGSIGASTALGAIVPGAVEPAATVPLTIAKTLAARAMQGAVLGATHQAVSNFLDNEGKIDWGDTLKSGEWGALFGAAGGALEAGGQTALTVLKSLQGKTPVEAAQTVAESPLPPEQQTALQQRIEEMVGYKNAQTAEKLPAAPATFYAVQEGYPEAGLPDIELYNLTEDIPGHPAGSTVSRQTLEKAGFEVPLGAELAKAFPPVKSAAESAGVFEDEAAVDSMADAVNKAAQGITQAEKNYQFQLDQDLALETDPYAGMTPAEASGTRLQGEFPPVKSAAESAGVFEQLLDEERVHLQAMGDQFNALTERERSAGQPDNMPAMSSQAQRLYDQYGFVTPRVLMSLAGGGIGAAYGQMQPGTPEDRMELSLTYGALGATAGFGMGGLVERVAAKGGWGTLEALTNPATLRALWRRGAVNEALAYTRDAADQKAFLTSDAATNTVGNALQRVFPRGSQTDAQEALTFAVEARGDRSALDGMAAKIAQSTQARPYWKTQALGAIRFAQDNWDALSPIVQRYGEMTDAQVMRENANGVDTLHRPGYVMHAQELDSDPAAMGFRKVRTFDTFADSIAAGIDPKSINAVDLLRARVLNGEKLLNRNQWVRALATYQDPATGQPLVAPIKSVTRADGTTYDQAPTGYSIQQAGAQRLALLDGYDDIFQALNAPSAWQQSAGGRLALQANAIGKSAKLAVDLYHTFRIGALEGIAKLNPVGALQELINSGNLFRSADQMAAPIPAFVRNRGLTLVRNSEAELTNIASDLKWSPDQLTQALADKRDLDGLVGQGLVLGGPTSGLYQDLMHQIPLIGGFNKWLFGSFHPGAMAEVGLLELQRQRAMYPDLPDDVVQRQVARDVNVWFRSLGRQGIFKSQTAQDTARFLQLAPSWNEGGIRQEIGAIQQGLGTAVNAAQGRRMASGLLLRGTGAMIGAQFVANQVINYYTRGKPTWENPEEGMGAKISAWVPDIIGHGPGFFLNPLSIGAETAHVILSRFDKTQDFGQTMNDFIRSRSSYMMQPAYTFATGKDALGRPVANRWEGALADLEPLPIPSAAVGGIINTAVTGQRQEVFAGQFQRQALSALGVRTDQAPAPGQRIAALAQQFRTAQGKPAEAQFYGGDYSELLRMLRVGNQPAANQAMSALLEKRTPQQIDQYLKQAPTHPFTRNSTLEPAFFHSLNPEQQSQYRQAYADRAQAAWAARQLLRQTLANKPAQPSAQSVPAE